MDAQRVAQWIILILMLVSLLLGANSHGKPKVGNDSFWTALFSFVLFVTLIAAAGGFSKLFQ